jgi:hypothetical protein
MHRISRSAFVVFLSITLFGACKKIPDHVRYIPKDAVAVVGINLKALGKKIAWNMITGSKLFKEMQNRLPEKNAKNAMLGIEKAGIDAINTFYVYVKTDARFKGGNKITGLVPLADAGDWEKYVRQVFPQVTIKEAGDRKEASLGMDMYVGWNKNLLIIMNTMTPPAGAVNGAPDLAAASAEMGTAFGVTTDNSITGNKYFTSLEMAGHDITFWLNYDQLMTQYSGDMAQKVGMSLSGNALWKDAAFVAGFDFKKGKITGDMQYYMSADMKDIGTELGAANADKDMVERLPGQNTDMTVAVHLSPKGVKSIVEKMGLLGLANVGLSTQGMSVDDLLSAFTGDLAIVMNDFSLQAERVTDTFMGQPVVHQNQKPSLNMTYVMKLNKKENFQKIVKIARDNGLQPMGNGFVIPLDDKDSIYIMMNDQYAVASNKYVNAAGFLQGDFKTKKMPDALIAEMEGHPISMYVDIQQLFKNVDAGITRSAHDSVMLMESKKLLNNFSLTGGAFKDNAFDYHLDINFMNPDENSIIELMDYGMKMSDADKK